MSPRAQTALLNAVVSQLAASGLASFVPTPDSAIVRSAGATDLWDKAGALDETDAERCRTILDVDVLADFHVAEFNPSANPLDASGAIECIIASSGAEPTRVQARKEAGDVAGLPDLPDRPGSAEALLVEALARRLSARIVQAVRGVVSKSAERPPTAPARTAPDVASPGPPTSAEAAARRHMALGDTYLGQSKWEAAEEQYQLAIRKDPLMAAPHVRLGDIYADKGLWKDAVYHYKTAVELAPADIPTRVALARAYERAGQINLAENELQLAAKVDPANGSVHVSRGDLLQKLKRRKDAEAAYIAALEAQNPDTRACERLALLCADSGRSREALKYYVLAAKSAGEDDVPVVRRKHYAPMMALADAAVEEAMRQSREKFRLFEEGHITREEAFYALDACAEQTRDVARFVEMVAPPVDARAIHASREATYALVQQADAYLRDYVDTNDRSLLEYAQTLRRQAVEGLKALRAQTTAP
ncbi:MAG: tetratricopeptide repeat protein [Armatimonadota bacterium]